MSLYTEALPALRSIILVDERVRILAGKLDSLALEVLDIKERLVRLETIIEVTRPDGATLRLAPRPDGE